MTPLLAQATEVIVTDVTGAARDWVAGSFVLGLALGVALVVPVVALCVVTLWRGR